VGLGKLRIDRQRRNIFGDSLIRLSLRLKHAPEIVVRFRKRRIECKGAPIPGDGLVVAFLFEQRVATVVVCLRIARVQDTCPLTSPHRFLHIPSFKQKATQITPRRRIIRLKGNSLAEHFDSQIQSLRLARQQPQTMQSGNVRRLLRQNLAIDLLRLRELSGLMELNGALKGLIDERGLAAACSAYSILEFYRSDTGTIVTRRNSSQVSHGLQTRATRAGLRQVVARVCNPCERCKVGVRATSPQCSCPPSLRRLTYPRCPIGPRQFSSISTVSSSTASRCTLRPFARRSPMSRSHWPKKNTSTN